MTSHLQASIVCADYTSYLSFTRTDLRILSLSAYDVFDTAQTDPNFFAADSRMHCVQNFRYFEFDFVLSAYRKLVTR